MNPQYFDARYAAYGIVVAAADGSPASVLEASCLPGLRQTSMRAELFAIHLVIISRGEDSFTRTELVSRYLAVRGMVDIVYLIDII